MDYILIIAVILIGLFFLKVLDDGHAQKWLSDHSNQRLLRKCFGQEGIHILIHDFDKTVSVSFSGKGVSYNKVLTWNKAVWLYKEHPKGQGLRHSLVKEFS